MPRPHNINMIGSILYYALYPLSRYITSRRLHAGASKKVLPPSMDNDKALCDGGAVTARTLSQIDKLDQWLSQGSGTKGDTEERMKEPSPEQEYNTLQLMAVLHATTKKEADSKISEGESAVKEEEAETRNGQLQDTVEAPEQGDWEITDHHEVFNTKQNTEGGSISPTEDLNQGLAPSSQLACLLKEDSTQESPSPESVTRAEPRVQETTGSVQVQRLEKPMPPAEVTECWDEYLASVAEGGESSSELIFSSLLSNTQPQLKVSGQHETQAGWHFPAGRGLAEELQCPLWQFPTASYYPPIDSTVGFEVTWRVWEKVDESATAAEPLPFTNASMDFTVMSYNILADDLLQANQELYTHCPLEVLDWSYRCSLLLEEIQEWEPDILCLQEVQENHYHQQLYPALSQMGYTCVYKRRTGTKRDGCATCYRSSCFSEVSVAMLEFFRPETELLDRHNVGIIVLLRPVVMNGSVVKAKGPPLCVANTHLLFNPRRGDVKLAQLAIMLAEINSVIKSCNAKGEHCNLILCGDFNSIPSMPLYQLITTGELYFQGLPAWMISGQENLSHRAYGHRLCVPLWPSSLGITDRCQHTTASKEESKSESQKAGKGQYSHDFMRQLRFCPTACIRPLDLHLIPGVTNITPDASSVNQPDKSFSHTISHQLDLESVYQHVLPGFGNPEVTTLHSEGGSTVDYIFYSRRRTATWDPSAGAFAIRGLKLIGSLSLLSEDVLWSMKGLPNDIFPSDHLSLLARFQLDLNAA
ncbi:protein angel homolog 1 [Pseudochaenichthys georgianus]|uniref:protein angel homolog 1 n=1 Tax=Pseudochaenichthys georgianus TaxID=52239 RepID=UPI001469DC8E|nr:protein angel homolog 1 [Pseudochaenichthys georgianus]